MTKVYIEAGSKRVFACAVDWPGWCRSGRDEAAALKALGAYAARYGVVVKEAGLKAPSADFDVVERVAGSGGTDFGVPGVVLARDLEPITAAAAVRLATLVDASWTVFDRVVAGAPAELRKGPRGGGRKRDKIVDHVLGAEIAYAVKIGLRLKQPTLHDTTAIAARRIAWHILDHAWEMEDRST